MSRPKKTKINLRWMKDGKEAVPHRFHQMYVDPFLGEPLGFLYGMVIMGASPAVKKLAGHQLMRDLHDKTADELEDVFRRILNLKREWEKPMNQRPVHVRVLAFYGAFVGEYGFEPTWRRFKKALIEESEIPDLPAKEDKKGWYRLRKNACLLGMPKR